MFHKVLVANRGEIAIRALRAGYELGARTVAVFPHEDRNSLHRLKADESYQIGEPGHPVRAYLSVEEIVGAAQQAGADAVYPGYGFLAENPELARAAGIGSIKVLEGRVTLQSLDGSVTADIRRGPIDAVDLAGTVRLETGIGNVTAERMRLSPDGLLRLRAFNGNVTLTLAERPRDARILALALNGTIASEIPLNRKDTWGPRWSEATLGKGEPVISIDVVTGRIEIRAPK